MLSSNIYNYVNILDKAADATWLRQTAISNNIANQSTPGYKRKDVNFEGALEREITNFKYPSLDAKVENLHLDHLDVDTYIDSAGYSYRLDGNNVDPEQEYAELASSQIRYNALINSMTYEFSRIKSVIK